MRVLNFNDGFDSNSEPLLGTIVANSLFQFSSDSSFVSYKGIPASSGDIYFNTTLNHVRWFDGTIWVSGLFQDASGNVVVVGNLTVQGTTTTINTENLQVTDKNITVNKNGTDLTAQGAGLTVEREGADGSFVYDSSKNSKWKAGDVGAESEVVTASHEQTLTNKTLTAPQINNPTGITKADVGLSNVNNTSDANKPISTATQAVLADLQDQIDNFQSLPAGGTAGQALVKVDGTDGNAHWVTIEAGVYTSTVQSLAEGAQVVLLGVKMQRVIIKGEGGPRSVVLPDGAQDAQILYIEGSSDTEPATLFGKDYTSESTGIFVWSEARTKWMNYGGS